MHPCPSCGAPLDDEGICTSCGALARSFFRGLDLGAPQIADAVARGLDFYRLLDVEPSADTRTVARRYRQLRVFFPDDPSDLAPASARKLALLEAAGRALTDPRLRKIYDDLRTGHSAELRTETVRCAGCAAPLPTDAARCPFCGTQRPVEPALPTAPPAPTPDDRPPAEPVDYYALLGLTPLHLLQPELGAEPLPQPLSIGPIRRLGDQAPRHVGPPKPADVDAVALARQRELLLAPGLTPVERDARVTDLEVARRILH
ncbi:MAG TPA: DnaJ domain-containing protein, partial [Candidatus Limnocylindrales bacterium]